MFELSDVGLTRLQVVGGGGDDEVSGFLKIAGDESGQGGFADTACSGEEDGACLLRAGESVQDELSILVEEGRGQDG